MNEEFAAHPAAEACGTAEEIRFDARAARAPAWYDWGAPAGALLTSAAVAALCVWMLLEPGALTRICGAVALAAYGLYAARYFAGFARSRRLRTTEARLTETVLEVSCKAWTKRLPVREIVFTMSYSSSTNLCLVAATETDYATISCSCGYLLAREGRDALVPFYALNKRFMQWNPKHVNYVRNKRYRRQNPFRVPLFVFETEYDSPRAARLVALLRERYRFR